MSMTVKGVMTFGSGEQLWITFVSIGRSARLNCHYHVRHVVLNIQGQHANYT